jgi:hypothetical protein
MLAREVQRAVAGGPSAHPAGQRIGGYAARRVIADQTAAGPARDHQPVLRPVTFLPDRGEAGTPAR